eukprot:gnl/Ergobibamus_cyprinoides/20.p1 GENE.gnl/Ergobibamus_cyprinoides/20~~gnl/Ergobibamus_cyprinoides/20.p1  ORF type:complete len:389 (+),score=164.70 gnl/Ergobibamus_cyprinoides/20:48-1169(+)
MSPLPCGFDMPIEYEGMTISESHKHTREAASVFDVGHMGQLRITGKDHEAFIESITVADVTNMPMHQTKLSVMTTPDGGIIDDLMVTRYTPEEAYMVINAGCKDKDVAHILSSLDASGMDVTVTDVSERALIALQGPKASAVLQQHVPFDLSRQHFMSHYRSEIAGVEAWVTRCGYTGEDGFEISVPREEGEKIARLLLAHAEVAPAGLGPRDSLRLEAGLNLYGHEIDTRTTPVEAGLTWLMSKRRRAEGGFPGDHAVQDHLANGVTRHLVGVVVPKGAPARERTQIYAADGETLVGHVTSGLFSPMLRHPIAMAYVNNGSDKAGTPLKVKVRGKLQDAVVVPLKRKAGAGGFEGAIPSGGFYRGGDWDLKV